MDPRYQPVVPKYTSDRREKCVVLTNKIKSLATYVPWFIFVVGLVQTALWVTVSGSSPLYQLLLYLPNPYPQLWRYVSYMLLHRDSVHLFINLFIQTLVAVPLEAEQGVTRTAVIYLVGGVAGALGTAVLDPELSMVGASAGIYALILAHLPNIFYNSSLLRYKWYRVLSVVCLCLGDVCYSLLRSAGPIISWAAHISGATSGFLLGFTIFTSYTDNSSLSVALLRYASLILFTILFTFCILYIHSHKHKAVLHYLVFFNPCNRFAPKLLSKKGFKGSVLR